MDKSTYSRRDFLKTSSVLGGGFLLSFSMPLKAKSLILLEQNSAAAFTPNAYLSIGTDSTVKVILAHVEMGQGIWTTLPMLIAEELDCDWSKIAVEHAPPGEPYKHVSYGVQMTGSSTSTYSEFERYRKAGATARMMLMEAAANKFKVATAECRTENGFVIAGNQRISYGELAEAANKLTPPATVVLKDKKDWRFIGKSMKRLDAKAKITGQAQFGIDVHLPDMLIAVVAHPPVFGATVKSFDASATKKIKGVQDIVQIPKGVAVLAKDFWTARKGVNALKIEWNLGEGKNVSTTTQIEAYRKLAETKGTVTQSAGNTDEGFAKASKKIEAEYIFPYLAHAPMEPINCTVKISGDTCEIWAGIQMPMIEQANAAKVLGFKPEQVTVNTMFMGGAFGRRTTFDSDFVVEAVHIAKASSKTIKLVWTREDDIKGGYYRAAFMHKVNVGLDTEGSPIAWQHRIVGQSIHQQGTPFSSFMKNGIDGTSIEGVRNSPYLTAIPHQSIELHSPKLPVPVLWWRAVGHTHIAYVMETMVDELAFAAGKDPIAYRQNILKGKRQLAALNLVAEKSDWHKPLPTGRFRGVAVHESFGSTVAYVSEISIQNGELRFHKVTCAIDCGLAVNPDGVKAQMEGGIIFGLSAVLYGEITLENGRVQQSNFHDYKMLRINEAPIIEVHIVDSNEKMGGAGEPCVPPIAPSVANAIFAATGNRVRKLPVQASDLVKA